MLYDLTNEQDREFAEEFDFEHHNPLQIANAIFVGKDVTLRRDFAQSFMDYYRGTVINVDFLSPDAVRAVNAWASDHTDGLITDLVQEFDPLTVAAIANAVYFSDRWRQEFNPDQTTEGVFHAPTGEQSAYFMLREGDDQLYYEDDLVQAIQLLFLTGGGMTILLPKSGDAVELLSNMTHTYFEEIQNGFTMLTGRLLLPRFSIESTIDNLDDILTALGVPLFDEDSSPLTNGLIYEDMPVWLSGALQKAMIEVDERGTTAAAVMLAAAPTSAPPQPEPFEMICDRPFVFVLHQRTYDGGRQVLFTGVVNQP
jgi:serpin B